MLADAAGLGKTSVAIAFLVSEGGSRNKERESPFQRAGAGGSLCGPSPPDFVTCEIGGNRERPSAYCSPAGLPCLPGLAQEYLRTRIGIPGPFLICCALDEIPEWNAMLRWSACAVGAVAGVGTIGTSLFPYANALRALSLKALVVTSVPGHLAQGRQ